MTKMTKPKTSSSQSIDYTALKTELDNLLQALQSGELELDEAIATHKRGQDIINQLEAYLKTAQNKIKKVVSAS